MRYTEERARQVDTTTKQGDILVVDNGDGEIAVIIRDDTAERRGLSQPGKHWSSDPNDDPMDLYQHIKYAVAVHRVGELISAEFAPTPITGRFNHIRESELLPPTPWDLTPESTITIEGNEYKIPPRINQFFSGGFISPRICAALEAAGYRPVGGNFHLALDADGPGTIALERIETSTAN